MFRKILAFLTVLSFAACGGGKSELEKNINIEVYPLNINFGTVEINSEDFRTITITHVGSEGTLQLYKVYLTDESSKEFSTEGASKTALEKAESTFVTIFYRPKDGAADNGQLVIEHNVPPNFKSVVNISALAQMAHLTTIPNPINFGEVVSGADKIMDVRVKNIGADKISVDMIYVKGGSGSDFSIENIADVLPKELSPDGELYLQMKYTPKGAQNDVDYLVVEGKSKDSPVVAEFQILGSELGPEIVVSPGLIDFGYVLLNEKETKQIYIYNEGNYELKVAKVYPSLGSDANIVVENFPEEGFVIESGDNKAVDVSWTPKELKPPSPDPIGWIVIESNDGNSPQIQIEAFGMIDSPQLIVTPPDTVE
ncbi:MAG: choice-of-anchor D domain-containing protein, partial [Deltaproteobacteria bacterium]|nr:choice-of-anchor D domain-containing protein [Deltaproteobacteria bacterium]